MANEQGEPAYSMLPVPDPTVLTTEALRREIDGLRQLIGVRLDAMDAARTLLVHRLDAVPEAIKEAIGHSEALEGLSIEALEQRLEDADGRYKERFDAADLRYQQRYDASDKALAAASQAAQGAVNAALAAAKEAVLAASISAEKSVAAQNESNSASILKSEMSVTKQIDSIMILLTTSAKTLDEKIAAINSRLDRGDGVIRGNDSAHSERRLDTGTIIAMIVAGIASAGLLVNILNSHIAAPPVTERIIVEPGVVAAPVK